MTLETNKFERTGNARALISKDVGGLQKRKQEIAMKKRIGNLEQTVNELNNSLGSLETKLDMIISLMNSNKSN